MLRNILLTATLLLVSLSVCQAQELTLWGYNLDSSYGQSGYGSSAYYNPPLSCAMFVPGNGELKGAKIHAINMPATSSDYTDITVWGVEKITQYSTSLGTKMFEKAYTGPITPYTYHRVDLDTPVEIPATGMFVGMTFTSYYGYPFAMNEGYAAGSSWDDSWQRTWYDVSDEGKGVSAIQIFVSNVQLKGYAVTFESATCRKSASGQEAFINATLASTSAEPVRSITYKVFIEGKEQTHSLTLPEPIPAGISQKGRVSLPFTAPSRVGNNSGFVYVTEVNGQTNTTATPFSFKVNVVEHIVPRYSVIEEYTGTGCPNCQRGWLGMKHVKETMGQFAGVIAIHQYNTSDPMYCDTYSVPEYGGAPECHIDRNAIGVDPYEGDTRGDIMQLVELYNDIEPEAEVTVDAAFTDDTYSSIAIASTTRFLASLPGATIAYAITADGLTGTNNAWKQSNNLSEKDAAGMGDLAIFCKGGEYGESAVLLTYDDVLVGSSWTAAQQNLAPAFLNTAINAEEHTTLTLTPEWVSILRKALDFSRMYVTAMVIKADGTIANAARCRIHSSSEATGIALPHDSTPARTDAPTFDLQGRRVLRQESARKQLLIKDGRKLLGV